MASQEMFGISGIGGRKASRQAGFMNGHDTESSEGKKQEGSKKAASIECVQRQRRRMLP